MKKLPFKLLGLALTGAMVSGAALVTVPAGPAHAQDTASDLAYAECHYDHDFDSCQFLAEQGQNITEPELKCLAAAGITIAGLAVGDGIGEELAADIARKYLAAGATGCLGSFL
ncbi:hypothetical protein [Clavibacter sp. Sh2088]|uniref:hypothetical protein n=1 Tax=Clavibacter sp. Sh2088 TaxID=3397676 RepID=UPI0039E1ED3E